MHSNKDKLHYSSSSPYSSFLLSCFMTDISSYLQKNLNEQQYAAASYTSGNSLILAGAGSGKTRTLTYKIANLIYGEQTHPSNILAVTFTNKAATEMKGRLQDIMNDLA